MNVKRLTFAMAALVAVLGLTVIAGFTAGAASADTGTNCTTDSNGTVTCVDQTLSQTGQASDHESDSAKAVGTSKTGVTYLVAEHLVSKAKVRQAEKNGQCRWFAKIWNSGFINGSGKMGWKLDHHVYACKINGRWYKEGGGVTGKACENLLRLVTSPPPVHSRVTGKVEFVDHMTWEATASVRSDVTATVSVSVSVHNADYSCQASASSTATSHGVATASATARASSKVEALNKAHGTVVTQLDSIHQQASANATATAKATATAQAEVHASCSPSTTPTPATPPTITDVYQLNSQTVYEGYTYTLCATVQAQSGDSITVTFAPHVGAVSQAQFTITGSGQVCTTYTAPGEQTTDYYTVYAHDNTNNTNATPVTSDPWQVQPLQHP